MYEGKPVVLVIGGTDTGRTPIAAALLRKALGAGAVVWTAGVLSHEGEGATPEAQMALEQLGIDISGHISRPLRYEEHRDADLLLAVDRGTELVLFAEFPNDPRVGCLAALADTPDVLDPHRMPLGVWIAATRQIHDQVTKALPLIRRRLGIEDEPPAPFEYRTIERSTSNGTPPLVLGTGKRMDWGSDEEMQRLMGLIENGAGEPDTADRAVSSAIDDTTQADESNAAVATDDFTDESAETHLADAPSVSTRPVESRSVPPTRGAATRNDSRPDMVHRMVRIVETAAELPEIVDWNRVRQELTNGLRVVAQRSHGALDFAPAAALMIEGKLAQHTTQPSADALHLLSTSLHRLGDAVKATDLATIGGELGQW